MPVFVEKTAELRAVQGAARERSNVTLHPSRAVRLRKNGGVASSSRRREGAYRVVRD